MKPDEGKEDSIMLCTLLIAVKYRKLVIYTNHHHLEVLYKFVTDWNKFVLFRADCIMSLDILSPFNQSNSIKHSLAHSSYP